MDRVANMGKGEIKIFAWGVQLAKEIGISEGEVLIMTNCPSDGG